MYVDFAVVSDAQLLTQCASSHMDAQERQTGWDVGMSGTPPVGCFREALSACLKPRLPSQETILTLKQLLYFSSHLPPPCL